MESSEKERADKRTESPRESVARPEDLLPRLRENHRYVLLTCSYLSLSCCNATTIYLHVHGAVQEISKNLSYLFCDSFDMLSFLHDLSVKFI